MRTQLAHTSLGLRGRTGAMMRKGKPRPRLGPGAGAGGPGAGSPGGGHSPTAKPEAAWKEDTLEGLEKGSRVWVRLSGTAWALATLQGPVGAECLVSLDTGDGLEQVWTSTSAGRHRAACAVCHAIMLQGPPRARRLMLLDAGAGLEQVQTLAACASVSAQRVLLATPTDEHGAPS